MCIFIFINSGSIRCPEYDRLVESRRSTFETCKNDLEFLIGKLNLLGAL